MGNWGPYGPYSFGCASGIPVGPPSSPIVTFNYDNWVQLFPQFSYITAPMAQNFFNAATNYCRNDGGGPVCNPNQKIWLLNLLTAHLVQLFANASNGQPPSPLVGRISNASEGSVSVGTDYPSNPSSAWYNQTPFGAAYFEGIKPFRTFRYMPGVVRNQQPWPFQ